TGQSCVVNVTFKPAANGSRTGVFSVTSIDPGFDFPLSGVTAALSGSGIGVQSSQLSLRPAALNFGIKSTLDVSTHSKNVQVTNTSTNTSMTIQSVTALTPIFSGFPFYKIGSTNCIGMLAPGAPCNVKVEVVPSTGRTTLGPDSAFGSIMIVASDGASPHVVPLTATLMPEVRFTPASLNFPSQTMG